jgi:CBS domain-containing protein
LNRVVAKGLSPDDTLVGEVMTPNPDCVDPDLTLIDALREMHDQKYLHLPVREAGGRVVGLVDVMELVRSTAGEGETGGKGWRNFFDGVMNARGDRDVSDAGSNASGSAPSAARSKARSKTGGGSGGDGVSARSGQAGNGNLDRAVSKLRPKAPITVDDVSSIFEVAKQMAASRVDAALLIGQRGDLAGIITGTSVCRCVCVCVCLCLCDIPSIVAVAPAVHVMSCHVMSFVLNVAQCSVV